MGLKHARLFSQRRCSEARKKKPAKTRHEHPINNGSPYLQQTHSNECTSAYGEQEKYSEPTDIVNNIGTDMLIISNMLII
jgi:hypothetical protein